MSFVPATLRFASFIILLLLIVLCTTGLCAQDKLTSDQSRQLRHIKSGVERAARLYESKKLDEASKLIQDMAVELKALVDGGGGTLIDASAPMHQMLVDARKVLIEAGQALPPIDDLPVPADRVGMLAFSNDIVPILVTNCGTCHVDQARGQFSMASFSALANGLGGAPVIVPGKPDESHLIEMITTKTMPPSGNGIPDADLEKLKKWISDGAQYDMPDPNANLRMIAQANGQPSMEENAPEIVMATGEETISFAVDIAPILIDNCVGCHFEAQNAEGGLSIDNFRQLLHGGDSGPIVQPGDSAGSTLILRLTATDNTRMPQRRPALSKEVMAKIVKWIDEGARFDGRQPQMNLRLVSAIVKSERASHDQLATERAVGDLVRWKKVMLDEVANEVTTDDFRLLGSADDEILERVGQFAQSQASEVRKQMGIADDQPIVKGRTTLFVFTRRYDFNEFGKMIEGRDMPPEWKLHWGYDTVNAYVALQLTDGELGDQETHMQQAIGAVAMASSGAEVPRWFADAAGFTMAESMVADRKAIAAWRSGAVQAASEMQNPDEFLNGGLSEDRAALVGYGFLQAVVGNRKQFQQIVTGLNSGASLDECFVAIFGKTPAELVQAPNGGIGKNGKRNR